MNVYDSVLGTVGRTPLIRLKRVAPEGANVLVKQESRNPLGSVKDRIAVAMVDAAEASGALLPGGTLVEPTSGNTGIGLEQRRLAAEEPGQDSRGPGGAA